MSKDLPKSSLTDAMQRLSETVDRTVHYIHRQRAQNKTKKEIIAKQIENTIQRTVELLETKRQNVLSQEEALLWSHQNDVNTKELDDLNTTIQRLKLEATRLQTENSKVSLESLQTNEFFKARIASLENTKAEEDAAARAEVDRLKAEHIASLEQTRIQAKDAAVLELKEKARLKQLEDEKKQKEEMEEAEQLRVTQEQQNEVLREQRTRDDAAQLTQRQEREVPDDTELNQYILQLLIYYACPRPPWSKLSWKAMKSSQPPQNKRYNWYAKLLGNLQTAREHYNNVRPIKTFLVVRHDSRLQPLIMVEANTIVVKTLESGMKVKDVAASVPDNSFDNNFTVISKGDIESNFQAILPKFVVTDGTIAHERTIVVYGPSGTGKTSQIHKFIDNICQSHKVEYFVVELYGYDFTNKDLRKLMIDGKRLTDELKLFLLENREDKQPFMQEDVNLFPTLGRKKEVYKLIEHERELYQPESSTLLFRGYADDIKKTMNSGVYKKTTNNNESSRGFIFIKILVNEKTYCLCDFPGSEENIAQEGSVIGRRNSYLIGESFFFTKMLPYFQKLFEAKAQKKEMDERIPFHNVPPIVHLLIKKWFIDRSVAMVFTASGNYENGISDEVRKKNNLKFVLSLKLFEFVKNLDGREKCVSQEEAEDYFGAENMENPAVRSLIKSSSSEGGSKNKMTRKRYGRKINTRRFRR